MTGAGGVTETPPTEVVEAIAGALLSQWVDQDEQSQQLADAMAAPIAAALWPLVVEARREAKIEVLNEADEWAGFALWLDREQWGHVLDGLIVELARARERQAANSESTSGARADDIAALIKQINSRALVVAEHDRAGVER